MLLPCKSGSMTESVVYFDVRMLQRYLAYIVTRPSLGAVLRMD